MRLAKLIDEDGDAMYVNPSAVVQLFEGNRGPVVFMTGNDSERLSMDIDEAVAEINAAMADELRIKYADMMAPTFGVAPSGE